MATGCKALLYETQLPMKKGTKLKDEDEKMKCRRKKVAHRPVTENKKRV